MRTLGTHRAAPSACQAIQAVLVGIAILAATWPGTARAIVTSDGVGTHVVEPGVPALGVNLDGVVYLDDGDASGSGALISDTHVLTAAHVIERRPYDFTVRFDLADGPVWIPVKGYAMHPNYNPIIFSKDIAVIELASPAPAGVPRYELHTTQDEVGKPFVVAGYGMTGSGATGATFFDDKKRAGLNRFEAIGTTLNDLSGTNRFTPTALFYDFDSGLAANDLTPLVTGSPDLGFGDDEVGIAPGDSGGPAFIEGDDGIFRIAGITAFAQGEIPFEDFNPNFLEGINSSWGEVMGSEPVSTNLDFIHGAMAGNMRYQRLYSDGLTHVIDDVLDDGPVIVGNSPAPDDAATTVILRNAILRGLPADSLGLRVAGSSLVEMEAGLIEGNSAASVEENGRLHISGGTIRALPLPSIFSFDEAIIATGNAEVRVSGGTVEGLLGGLFALADTQVFITGGTFTAQAHALYLGGTAEIDGGSFFSAGDGLRALSSGLVTIRGGTFHGDARGGHSTNTSAVAISAGTFTSGNVAYQASGSSVAAIAGGSFDAPFAFFANDQALVWIGGGTFTGSTDAFQSTDTAGVTIEGGIFEGGIVGLSALGSTVATILGGEFYGDQYGVLADFNADLLIEGGIFSGNDGLLGIGDSFIEINDGTFEGTFAGAKIGGNAEADIHGGNFTGDEEDGLYVLDNATVRIFGGSFSGGETDIYLQDAAVLRIYGYGFNLPLGSMANSSVTLTGTYFDGTPFVHVIEVTDASELELVSGYEGWAAFHGLEGNDALLSADANGNGIPNALELVFGGNPASGGATQAIETSSVSHDHGSGEQGYLKITHPVTELSAELDVVPLVEYSGSLAPGGWTAAQHGVAGVVVVTTPDAFAPGVHKTETWIPKSLATDGRLFARVGAESL